MLGPVRRVTKRLPHVHHCQPNLPTGMQHKDYKMTQRYINMARQLNPALEKIYVPDLSQTVVSETA
jgi:hypothetical protein